MSTVRDVSRTRIFFSIFLPLIFSSSIVGWGVAIQQSNIFLSAIKSKESNIVEIEKRQFDMTLMKYISDVVTLADITRTELSRNQGPAEAFSRLAEIFIAYAQNQRLYDQIRFIDPSGMERTRVNWSMDKGGIAVPLSDLQNKKSRPYFVQV